jgi:hypothetical protein
MPGLGKTVCLELSEHAASSAPGTPCAAGLHSSHISRATRLNPFARQRLGSQDVAEKPQLIS